MFIVATPELLAQAAHYLTLVDAEPAKTLAIVGIVDDYTK